MAKKKAAKGKKKMSSKMTPWLKFSYPCMQDLGIKLKRGVKWTGAQKKKHRACVVKKARAAGISMDASKGKK